MTRVCWTLLMAGLAASVVGCAEPSGPVTLVHGQVLTVQLSSLDDTRAVDILFVIDDSSSMAQAQANLAANFHRFIEVLEDPFVDVDYRVALTTTDSGNPRCPGSSSERGALVARPCTQRLDDFVLGDLDMRALACTDVCTLSDAELEIVPTTTERDELAKPRPWLEHIAGTTNLPAGVELADAFACMAPQGIAGCDFEAPLESMVLALDREGLPRALDRLERRDGGPQRRHVLVLRRRELQPRVRDRPATRVRGREGDGDLRDLLDLRSSLARLPGDRRVTRIGLWAGSCEFHAMPRSPSKHAIAVGRGRSDRQLRC